jgi:hypothetical protein
MTGGCGSRGKDPGLHNSSPKPQHGRESHPAQTAAWITAYLEATGGAALALLVSIPAVYSFSRFEWKGRKALQFWYLSLLLVGEKLWKSR